MEIKIVKMYNFTIDTDSIADRLYDDIYDMLSNYIEDEIYDIVCHRDINKTDIDEETWDTIKKEIVNKIIKQLIDEYDK